MAGRPQAIFLAALLVVIAGCAGVGSLPGADAGGRRATVTDVVDGDTVDIRYDDGDADTVRLLGVDSPELDGRSDPAEFEDVPDTEAGRRCLAEAAGRSAAFAERSRAGERVRIVTDAAADRRDRYGRLLAYVVLSNGTDLNYRLVDAGHARVYDAAFSRSERFYAAEAEAQAAGEGLWRCRDTEAVGRVASDAPLEVVTVHADAAGDDHADLGD